MSDFFGKVIAITGGASGIGLALAELLISKGCIVSIADADRSALHHAVLDIEKAFPGTSDKVLPVELDVRKPGAVDIWLKDTVDRFGRLDGAANLAGVTPKPANGHPIRELDDKDWDTLIAVNLTGLKNCVKSELGLMQSGASIVNASSVAGLRGQHNYTAYSVTKAGVIALTKCAAKEEGPRGIRINAIAPGFIDTPMFHALASAATDVDMEAVVSMNPIARKGKPEEVAKLIAFLLSDDSAYMTGTVQVIDGGFTV